MADQNEFNPIADVPASEDLVNTEAAEATSGRSWKQNLSWAAVAAALVVGGVGGYAAGNSNGDHGRLELANEQGVLPGGPQGGQGPDGGRHGKHGHDGQFGGPQDGQPGLPGQPGQGIDPDGDNWTGTNKQDGQLTPNNAPAPSASSSASPSTLTQ